MVCFRDKNLKAEQEEKTYNQEQQPQMETKGQISCPRQFTNLSRCYVSTRRGDFVISSILSLLSNWVSVLNTKLCFILNILFNVPNNRMN